MPEQIFTKRDLVNGLRRYAAGQPQWRGLKQIAMQLASWLEAQRTIPNDDPSCSITYRLPRYLAEAFAEWRELPEHAAFRKAYARETDGQELPSLFGGGVGDLHRALTVQTMGFMLRTLDEGSEHDLDSYLNAATTVISQKFHEWIFRQYTPRLFRQIEKSRSSGMSAKFGPSSSYDLRTFVSAGRVMITFAVPGSAKQRDLDAVTFIGEEGEPRGTRFGLQSFHTSLVNGLMLLEAAIAGDYDLVDDEKIGLG